MLELLDSQIKSSYLLAERSLEPVRMTADRCRYLADRGPIAVAWAGWGKWLALSEILAIGLSRAGRQ